tara:strand:- start:13647 stop:15065 length:1419 start_codon:yes stop_codon:yes gene_type:complete
MKLITPRKLLTYGLFSGLVVSQAYDSNSAEAGAPAPTQAELDSLARLTAADSIARADQSDSTGGAPIVLPDLGDSTSADTSSSVPDTTSGVPLSHPPQVPGYQAHPDSCCREIDALRAIIDADAFNNERRHAAQDSIDAAQDSTLGALGDSLEARTGRGRKALQGIYDTLDSLGRETPFGADTLARARVDALEDSLYSIYIDLDGQIADIADAQRDTVYGVGPIGPQGPTGPEGPAGADGATGPAGADAPSDSAYKALEAKVDSLGALLSTPSTSDSTSFWSRLVPSSVRGRLKLGRPFQQEDTEYNSVSLESDGGYNAGAGLILQYGNLGLGINLDKATSTHKGDRDIPESGPDDYGVTFKGEEKTTLENSSTAAIFTGHYPLSSRFGIFGGLGPVLTNSSTASVDGVERHFRGNEEIKSRPYHGEEESNPDNGVAWTIGAEYRVTDDVGLELHVTDHDGKYLGVGATVDF